MASSTPAHVQFAEESMERSCLGPLPVSLVQDQTATSLKGLREPYQRGQISSGDYTPSSARGTLWRWIARGEVRPLREPAASSGSTLRRASGWPGGALEILRASKVIWALYASCQQKLAQAKCAHGVLSCVVDDAAARASCEARSVLMVGTVVLKPRSEPFVPP